MTSGDRGPRAPDNTLMMPPRLRRSRLMSREVAAESPRQFSRIALISSLLALLSIVLYLGLVLNSKNVYGLHRILGFDTLTYAFTARETVAQGIAFLMAYWGHPNLYVLLLGGITLLGADAGQAANIVPIASIAALAVSGYHLTRKISESVGTAILAGILFLTAGATLRLFVDLHRALFALPWVVVLLALNSPHHLSRVRLHRWGLLSLGLLFLVAFSEYEIYLAFAATLVLHLVLRPTRLKRGILVIAWTAIPGLLFLLTPSGLITLGGLADLTSAGIAKPLNLELALFLLSTAVTVPFALLGIFRLLVLHRRRETDVPTLVLSWVIVLTLVFLIFGLLLQKISPFRALILLLVPVPAALGVETAARGVTWMVRTSKDLPRGHTLALQAPERTGPALFAIVAGALVVVSGTITFQSAPELLSPVVPENLYAQVARTVPFVAGKGWPTPVYLVLNQTYLDIYAPIRLEISLLGDPVLLYFGHMNFVPWAVPPHLIDPIAVQDRVHARTLAEEYERLTTFLEVDALGLLNQPLVVLTPALFHRTLPDAFSAFEVDPGLYVIPPGALSLETFLQWEIRAAEDAYALTNATVVNRPWSRYGRVVETAADEGYEISFPYYFPVTGGYEVAVHLFDFPSVDNETQRPYSPLELWVGAERIGMLTYGANAVVWWNTTLTRAAGFEVITLRAAEPDQPFRMSLDTLWVSAVTT